MGKLSRVLRAVFALGRGRRSAVVADDLGLVETLLLPHLGAVR